MKCGYDNVSCKNNKINAMKRIILPLICALAAVSCVKQYKYTPEEVVDVDIDRFVTSQEYEVPVRDGYVTQVIIDENVVAEAVSPMSIMLPKSGTDSRAGGSPELNYVPLSEYPNQIEIQNSAKLYQVICFEDSRESDYDYNDLVIHVIYKIQGNKFGFGVHPVALGSTKSLKLGCAVYKGNALVYKGLITPEGKDCREQYFESQTGFINTVGTDINQENGGWNGYLGSTIRNWNMDKLPGQGAMRVEWYIEIEGGRELFALSTKYLNHSFNKELLPYGLVVTETGAQYIENGMVCGKDWFNYPQEGSAIKEVYPEIWEWLTSDAAFNFNEIYDRHDVPEKAFPASDLGLYIASDADILKPQYLQN